MHASEPADPASHESLLRTRLYSVERRRFDRGEGTEDVLDIVVHPGAVVILPLFRDERIVMIRNHRYAADEELWELPAGTLEPYESPIVAAGRELEEETGYLAGRVEPFVEFFSSPGICTELMRSFVARDLTPTRQRLEAGERIRVEIVDVEFVRGAILDGTIRDGKTMATLGAYLLQREAER